MVLGMYARRFMGCVCLPGALRRRSARAIALRGSRTFAWSKPCVLRRLRELRKLRAGSPIFAEKNRSEALWNILFFECRKRCFSS